MPAPPPADCRRPDNAIDASHHAPHDDASDTVVVADLSHLALLRRGRWFADLDHEVQQALVVAGRVRTLADGARLFSRGDDGDGLYAAIDGALCITAALGHGERASSVQRVLDVTQEQLAAMLSSSRRSVNAALKDLEQEGLLKVAYGQITLVEVERLRAV